MALFINALLLGLVGGFGGIARPAVRSCRVGGSAQMCTTPAPIITAETISKIKSELWRVEGDAEGIVAEQSELISTLIGQIEKLPASATPAKPSSELNELLAPHLPLLLSHSFPLATRNVLQGGIITTEGKRAALLTLSEFVVGAQQEVADALSDLQWRQQQKLRELCDAALEGGTEACIELATAMKDE